MFYKLRVLQLSLAHKVIRRVLVDDRAGRPLERQTAYMPVAFQVGVHEPGPERHEGFGSLLVSRVLVEHLAHVLDLRKP